MLITEILEYFNYYNFETYFLNNENPFYKAGVSFFLVESTMIITPYKNVLSKRNVKTNKMECTKWTYHKE